MFLSPVPPTGSKVDKVPVSKAALPTKTGRIVCRIRDLLYWISTGDISAYIHNRGGKDPERAKVADRTVKSVRHDFHTWSYAGATVSIVDDELRKKYSNLDKATFVLADGHSGLQGLFMRLFDGNLTEEELDFPCVLTVAPSEEFLNIYTHRNIQSGQTASQTLANPDLLYGDVIHNKIYPRLKPQTVEILKKRSKLLGNLSYIIEVWKRRKRGDFGYLTAFHARMETKSKSILKAGTEGVLLNTKDCEELAAAIDWYGDFITQLDERLCESAALRKQLNEIKCSAPFFGIILTDLVGANKPIVVPRNKAVGTMVNQAEKTIVDLALVLPTVTHSRNVNIETQVSKVGRTLKGR